MYKSVVISLALLAGPPCMAALPVAPFTTPSAVQLPYGLPAASLPPGTYRLNNAFRGKPDSSPDFRRDFYVGESRRRGDVVSVFLLERSIRRPNSRLNPNTPGYGQGLFLPHFTGWLKRYDCQNDRMQNAIYLSTSYSTLGDSLGFIDNGDDPPSRWRSVRGQVKVVIEGREYWAIPSRSGKSQEWTYVNPGTYGASEIDYVCTNF